MHLNQSEHNNKGLSLTIINEWMQRRKQQMNGEWRRQKEEVTRDIFEISKNCCVHKKNTRCTKQSPQVLCITPSLCKGQLLKEIPFLVTCVRQQWRNEYITHNKQKYLSMSTTCSIKSTLKTFDPNKYFF